MDDWRFAHPWAPGSWYAGKEYDRFFLHESDWAHPDTADTNVVDVLNNFAAEYSDWADQGFEIAGFVWWQGDKDRGAWPGRPRTSKTSSA